MIKFVAGLIVLIVVNAWITETHNVMTGILVMTAAVGSMGAGVLEMKS